MQTNRTNIAITPAEAAELSGALFSSGSAAAHELAPIFADIASGRLTSVELMLAGSQPGSAAEPIVIDGLSIDLASRTVKVLGVPASLTPKEFDILAFLATNRGTVFSKEEIYRAVWRDEYLLDDSNIMAFVRKIRKKIEPEPDNPRYLLTVWGVGYKMTEGRFGLLPPPIESSRTILAESQESRKKPAMCLVLRLFYAVNSRRREGEVRTLSGSDSTGSAGRCASPRSHLVKDRRS